MYQGLLEKGKTEEVAPVEAEQRQAEQHEHTCIMIKPSTHSLEEEEEENNTTQATNHTRFDDDRDLTFAR